MSATRATRWLLLGLLAGVAFGSLAGVAGPGPRVVFSDVTGESGVKVTHFTDAFGKKYLPETVGSGVCAIDFDRDGWQDLLFVNGTAWPGRRSPLASSLALYRNLGNGRFENVTRKAGLSRKLYGMGCAVGDYDNDGFVDVYVTALGANVLFRNRGDGTFADATGQAGVADEGWSTSAAWVDYDRDGHLDLFVGHFVKWSPETNILCTYDGRYQSYCSPRPFPGDSNRLFRNNGDRTFTDVTRQAGVWNPSGKTLAVAVYPGEDGWPNLVVGNDTQPNYLYVNTKTGGFRDQSLRAGIAFNENGLARSAMGVDVADVQNTGKLAIAISNFANEMISFYVQERGDVFFDRSGPSGIGPASLLSVSWGIFFFDYDLDGLEDLFVVNGHVNDQVHKIQPTVTHAQRPLLFLNTGGGAFREVGLESGPAVARKIVARGAAYLDMDNDGDLDVVITTNNGPAYLLRNEGGNRNRFVRLTLLRGQGAGDGIGARVTLQRQGSEHVRWVKSGSSYLAQSELPLTFGLGSDPEPVGIRILWPSGRQETLSGLEPNRAYSIREGRGAVPADAHRPARPLVSYCGPPGG
ncbi:MAG: CRTAC1 family protein [Actinomycetota bacterium]